MLVLEPEHQEHKFWGSDLKITTPQFILKKMKKLFISVLALCFLISGFSVFASGEVLDQEAIGYGVDEIVIKEPAPSNFGGQSFTTGEGVDNIKIFKAYFKKDQEIRTANIFVDIYLSTETDEPIGESLGQAVIHSTLIPLNYAWIDFIFEPQISLNPNTKYIASVSVVDDITGEYFILYWRYALDDYLGGDGWYRYDIPDLMFSTWYVSAPAPARTFTEISVPASTTPAILGMMSGFVGDMWEFIALIIGLPLGFWGVSKVIALVKGSFKTRV